jgi:hypothetical protein
MTDCHQPIRVRRHAAVEAPAADSNRTAERPLEQGPWVLLGPAKTYFATTEGGAAIDINLRVLNERGEVIPGLYAVGQNGLGGQVLWATASTLPG